ncbi:putative holin-like toxin [Veillonella sp. 3913]
MGGGGTMTLFEVLMLLIQFGLLVVAVLTYMQM